MAVDPYIITTGRRDFIDKIYMLLSNAKLFLLVVLVSDFQYGDKKSIVGIERDVHPARRLGSLGKS